MSPYIRIFIFGSLLQIKAITGIAQQPGDELNDTIILDEVAVSVLPFNQNYQESAGGVFLIDPETIDLKLMVNNTALFNLVPGVYMAAGTYNTNRLVIRGVGSRTPYNTNRIRAYLDDIPLTSGDGVSTLEDQDLRGIGQMEILKGPASSLYGSGLGGVVRLNSPYPQSNGFTATLSGEAGSFGTGLYGATGTYKNEHVALTGGVSNSNSKGFRDNSDYGRTNAFLNMRLFGVNNTLSLTLSMVDLFARIPSSLNETDYLNEPSKAGGSWLAIKGFEEYFRMLGGMSLESRLGQRFINKLVLFSTYADPYESRPFNIVDDQSANLGFREILRWDLDSWKFSTGAEYFHEWVDWKVFETAEGIQGGLLTHQKEIRKHLNSFAMIQWRPGEKLLLDGGINLNILSYGLQTQFRTDALDQSGSYDYRPVLSPRLGLSYRYLRDHHLYASSGHGFSAPSLEETLLPEGAVNTALRPETGWNFEIGNRGSFFNNRVRYDATLYTIWLKDLLVTERIAEDVFTGANAGRAMNSGLELWSTISLIKRTVPQPLDVRGILSYTISRNRFTDFVDDGFSYTGNALPGIPAQSLNTILSVRLHAAEMKVHFQHTGGQWMDDLNSIRYDGHQLIHFLASWKIKLRSSPFRVELSGGIRNILNASYASMILVNAPSFGGNAPRYYYPGNPRQFHLGASLYFR